MCNLASIKVIINIIIMKGHYSRGQDEALHQAEASAQVALDSLVNLETKESQQVTCHFKQVFHQVLVADTKIPARLRCYTRCLNCHYIFW